MEKNIKKATQKIDFWDFLHPLTTAQKLKIAKQIMPNNIVTIAECPAMESSCFLENLPSFFKFPGFESSIFIESSFSSLSTSLSKIWSSKILAGLWMNPT